MRVSQFGCGFSLRVGTLFIAWLQIVSGVLKVYFCSTSLAELVALRDLGIGRSMVGALLDLESSNIIVYYYLLSGVFSLFFGIILLISVEMKHVLAMKGWIAGTIIHMLCAILFAMFYTFCILDGSTSRVSFLESEVIGQAFSGYFMIVVYSYAKAICEGVYDSETNCHKCIPIHNSNLNQTHLINRGNFYV